MPVPPPPPPPLPPPPPPVGAPPPPPPPAPPVSTDAPSLRKPDPKGRSALLADIQQGTRLRKVTQINDRSAPQIESSKGTSKDGGGSGNSRGGSTPPALGDLFAGGFPVLRPAGQRDTAGGKTGQAPGSRAPSPRLPTKALGFPRAPVPVPPLPGANSEAPPPLPPKSPSLQVPNANALALNTPPGPLGSQGLLPKKRRGPGPSGGKLSRPPAPPARSPTTELSCKSQQPGGQLRNGSLHTGRTPGSWLQTEAAGQSSDDIKGRNSQVSLKALR
uniref:WAS/WASL interacting protein family, member 3 n=1 Tax=Jaculus jaculus TaxID=51337 RepID=A0A8C5KRN7_JACJA